MSRMTRAIRSLAFAALLAGFGCASPKPLTAPSAISPATTGPPVRVLMLTATAGFRHDSIATARQVMTALAASTGEFTIAPTEDLAMISATNLATFDVVFFANTSGELPLRGDQKAAPRDGRGTAEVAPPSDLNLRTPNPSSGCRVPTSTTSNSPLCRWVHL